MKQKSRAFGKVQSIAAYLSIHKNMLSAKRKGTFMINKVKYAPFYWRSEYYIGPEDGKRSIVVFCPEPMSQ